MFGARNKGLPHLAEYVSRVTQQGDGSMSPGLGCALSATMSGVGFFLLERFLPLPLAAVLAGLVLLPVFTGLVTLWIKHLDRPKSKQEERRREAYEAVLYMANAASRGKLHKRVDRAVGLLLEECARNWLRIYDAMSGPFWDDDDLPAHWKDIRRQARTAADNAMNDAIVILKPVLAEDERQAGAQDWVADILSTFLNVDQPDIVEPLPPVFLPARDVAQSLRDLADEIESTAQRATNDPAFKEQFESGTQISHVLSELRAIREAETELTQELGRSGNNE